MEQRRSLCLSGEILGEWLGYGPASHLANGLSRSVLDLAAKTPLHIGSSGDFALFGMFDPLVGSMLVLIVGLRESCPDTSLDVVGDIQGDAVPKTTYREGYDTTCVLVRIPVSRDPGHSLTVALTRSTSNSSSIHWSTQGHGVLGQCCSRIEPMLQTSKSTARAVAVSVPKYSQDGRYCWIRNTHHPHSSRYSTANLTS